jgi:hypothetical protein
MSKKRKIWLAIVSLLVLGIVCLVWYGFTPTHPISQEQAYALIAREVPMGSSRIEIEEWLGPKGWGNRCGYGVKDGFTVSSWFKGRKKDMTGYISCLIEDNSRIFLGNGDLFLVFYLDREDKLIQFQCKQVYNPMY